MRLGLLLLVGVLLEAQTPAQAERANRAKGLLAAQRFGEAAALYGELTKEIPNNAGLLLNHGMALHMAGEDARAIAPLEAALKLQPGIPPALLFLGASYLRTGQPGKALGPLEKFVTLDPNHLEARQMIADAATVSGQPARALPHLERLAAAEPKQPALWFLLGRSYEAAAAETFSRIEKQFPESGPFFALLAETRDESSQRRSAFFFYRKALEKSPELRGLRTAIARIYRASEHPEWALSEEAAEAKLGAPQCAPRTAECEFRDGKYQAALRLSRQGQTVNALYWRTKSYRALAGEAFAKLRTLPASVELYRMEAENHRDRGRHVEAAKAWEQALRLAPGQPDLEQELVGALVAQKDYARAQELTGKLLKAEPGSPDLLHLQGEIYLGQQLGEEALPYLEKAVKADGGNLPARASLARAYLLAGKAELALPHVNAALPLDTDGSLHFQLARAWQAAGKPDLAKAALEKYQQIQSRRKQQDRLVEEELQITAPQ